METCKASGYDVEVGQMGNIFAVRPPGTGNRWECSHLDTKPTGNLVIDNYLRALTDGKIAGMMEP